jgi:hypothetical protein
MSSNTTLSFGQGPNVHDSEHQAQDDPQIWILRVLILFVLGHQFHRPLVLAAKVLCVVFCIWISINQPIAFRGYKLMSVVRLRLSQGTGIAELQRWLECLMPAAFLVNRTRKLPKWLSKLAVASACCSTGPLIARHLRQGQRSLGLRFDPLASIVCLLVLLLALYHYKVPQPNRLMLTSWSYPPQLWKTLQLIARREPRRRGKTSLKPKLFKSISIRQPDLQARQSVSSKSQRSELARGTNNHVSWTTHVRYTTLKQDEIRLLRLLPTTKGKADQIRCNLEHVSLANMNEPYVALSYCWGEEADAEFIRVEEKPVPVTSNLKQVLRHLLLQGHCLLWIDALCINQANWEERSAQVLRMSSIYKKASEVAVWLGGDCDGSEKILHFLNGIDPDRPLSESVTNLMHHMTDKPTLEEFGALLRRPYWKRVWIVQEVAEATRVRILCGNISVPWDSMRRVVENLVDSWTQGRTETPVGLQHIVGELMLIHDLANIRNDRLNVRPLCLLQALIMTKSSKSTISHDKVYGLLGLAYDTAHFVSVPDYTLSEEAMCKAMTKSYITSTGNLDIILGGRQGTRPSSLPSWCPDYLHVADDPLDEWLVTYLSGVLRYRAGCERERWNTTGESRATPHQSIRFFDNKLVIRGWHVGTVNGLGGTLSDDFVTGDKVKCSNQPVTSPEAIALTYSAYNALCRMLLGYDRWYAKLTDAPILLGMLYNPAYWGFSFYRGGDAETVQKWLDLNRNFVIHGRRLRDRAWYSPFRVTGNILSSLLRSKAKIMTVADYPHVTKSIASIIGEGLRLMTTWEGHIGWAQPSALLEDEIFLFAGCSMPVILRRRTTRAGYHVVGHAYVDGIMDNELWSTIHRRNLIDVEIW